MERGTGKESGRTIAITSRMSEYARLLRQAAEKIFIQGTEETSKQVIDTLYRSLPAKQVSALLATIALLHNLAKMSPESIVECLKEYEKTVPDVKKAVNAEPHLAGLMGLILSYASAIAETIMLVAEALIQEARRENEAPDLSEAYSVAFEAVFNPVLLIMESLLPPDVSLIEMMDNMFANFRRFLEETNKEMPKETPEKHLIQ